MPTRQFLGCDECQHLDPGSAIADVPGTGILWGWAFVEARVTEPSVTAYAQVVRRAAGLLDLQFGHGRMGFAKCPIRRQHSVPKRGAKR